MVCKALVWLLYPSTVQPTGVQLAPSRASFDIGGCGIVIQMFADICCISRDVSRGMGAVYEANGDINRGVDVALLTAYSLAIINRQAAPRRARSSQAP